MGMIDIGKVDKNMTASRTIDKSGFDFYDVDEAPFRIYGVYRDGEKYRRLPPEVAKTVNEGVLFLHANTAGGRIRFVTNSKRLAFLIWCDGGLPTENGAYMNRGSLDVYADGRFMAVTRGGNDFPLTYYESAVGEFEETAERLITVYMPNYGEIHRVLVGIEHGATLSAAPDYKYEKPVLFYGSSITQGGCASRPGLTYESNIERAADMNYLNFGFSGRAHGEQTMARYINGLDISALVLDYDHNARDRDDLLNTHEPFFKTVREAHPDLPVIMISMPKFDLTRQDHERYLVIKRTYDNAIAKGDKNVYLIFGKELLRDVESDGLCDGCHPNDIGFKAMANGIMPVIFKALGIK